VNQDQEHLRLLAIFHYIVGGLIACVASIPLIHVAVGLFIMLLPRLLEHHSRGAAAGAPPAVVGLLFVILGGVFVVLGWTVAVLTILSGRHLARRRRPTFCFVVACLLCLWVPFGTVLGVFTIIVLNRPSVKTLFATPAAP
jgi:hypothetical protein